MFVAIPNRLKAGASPLIFVLEAFDGTSVLMNFYPSKLNEPWCNEPWTLASCLCCAQILLLTLWILGYRWILYLECFASKRVFSNCIS